MTPSPNAGFDVIGDGDPCAACGKTMIVGWHGITRHHTSYFPEAIVTVHQSCHLLIYSSNKYPHLKPPESDKERFVNEELPRRREERRDERRMIRAERGAFT